MDPRKRFGSRLKEARENKEMSQKELASQIGDGVQQNHISNYEAGNVMPRPERVIQFANILGVSEAWLRGLYADDEKEENLELPSRESQKSKMEAERSALDERAELVWRKKELEAQIEILELRKQLLAQENLFSNLSLILNQHIFTLNAMMETLDEEHQKQLEVLKQSLVEKVQDSVAERSVSGSKELQGALKKMESLFRPNKAELQFG